MGSEIDKTTADKPALTLRETDVLIAAIISADDFKLDMTKFVKYSSYATEASARVHWYTLKKKVLSMAGEEGLTSALATPRKRKTKAADGNEDDGDDKSTPTKKARTPKAAKAKAPAADRVKEDDGDEAMLHDGEEHVGET